MRALLLTVALGALSGCASCADLGAQKPFPCTQDGSDADQCPASWRCGLDNRCFDPSVGGKRICTDSARHCADGWRCGAPDTLNQQRCQQIGVGDAYPCQDSSDCEAAWQCDPVQHVCTLAVDELATSRLTGLMVEPISPSLNIGVPSFAAVGPVQLDVPNGSGSPTRGRVVGLVSDGGLYVATILEKVVDGPRVQLARYGIDEANLVRLEVLGTRVVGVFRDGQVLTWDRDSEASPLAGAQGARDAVALTVGAPQDNAEAVLALLRDADVVSLTRAAGATALVGPDAGRPIAAGGQRDGVVTWYQDTYALFLPEGPVLKDLVPVPPGIPPVTRLTVSGPLVLEVELDGGSRRAWMTTERDLSRAAGPCPICPFGAAPLQVQALADGRGGLSVRCPPEPSAGLPISRSWMVRLEPDAGCDRTQFRPADEDEAAFQHDFVNATTSLRWRAHAGAGGRAWYGEDYFEPTEGQPALHPVVLDRLPEFVGRLSLGGAPTAVALTDDFTFSQSPLGLTSEMKPRVPGELVLLGTVTGAPQLIITTEGVFNLASFPFGPDAPQQLAAPSADAPPLSSPSVGTLVPLPDGGTLLVVASRDALYGADVSRQLTRDGGVNGALLPPAALQQRLVPAPGVPVRDLAAGQLSTATSGSRGETSFYALAQDSVFGIAVLDVAAWQATPIPLPAEFGPPRELWTELDQAGNPRGRVAYRRGYISALPTPIKLADQFPDLEAADFARLCGDTLALVDRGLWRYTTDAGWLEVPGIDLGPDAGARFFESGPSAFIATADGRVLELFASSVDGGVRVCPRAP